MPLPDAYLSYQDRSRGMDQPFHGWNPLPGRKKAELQGGTKLVVVPVVPCAFFPLDPPSDAPKHADAMKTPYPDLRHFTVRDYGNRVGVYRILRSLAQTGIEATFAMDVATSERCPPLRKAITEAGHELAAHGVSSAHMHHAGLGLAEERELVARTREAFPNAVTWLSPGRNQSFATLPLLAEHGFHNCLDWEADMRPVPLRTKAGEVTALPHYNELADTTILASRSQSESEWIEQILTAAKDGIDRYEAEGAGCTALTFTPYVSGQPFRITALNAVLSGLSSLDGVCVTTAKHAAGLFASAA